MDGLNETTLTEAVLVQMAGTTDLRLREIPARDHDPSTMDRRARFHTDGAGRHWFRVTLPLGCTIPWMVRSAG